MKLVGWQRGIDKSTSGWVQANWRYGGDGSAEPMTFWVTGSGVEIAEAPLIPHTFYDGNYHADHGYTVQSTPAMTTYRHYSTSSEATADFPALPSGYEYRAGNGRKSVLARLTASRSDGLVRFHEEPALFNRQIRAGLLPYTGSTSVYDGEGYSYLFGPMAAPTNRAISYRRWTEARSTASSGQFLYSGQLGSVMGESAIYEPDSTRLVVDGLYPYMFQPYSWNSWAYDIDNVQPEDIRMAFQPFVDPWVSQDLDELPIAFDRVYTTLAPEVQVGWEWIRRWDYPYPAGDYWMRVQFELYVYHWMPVYGPDDGTWPPDDPPEDASGESTYITRAHPDYLYRAYEVDPNVVVERNTRIDTEAWTSVITPFAGTQPCVAQDVTGTPWVLYTDGTNVKRRNVITGAETTMATGKRPFERWAPGGAYRILTYWRITGAGPNGVVYYRRYDASGAAMDGSEQTLVSDVPEQAVSLDWQANGTITALYSDGTNIHTLTSTDNGTSWT